MLKVDPKKTNQLILSSTESSKLYNEIEDAFCELDTSIKGRCFSGERMEVKWPKLYELYRCLLSD